MQALNLIPAMTTDAERECYYRLVSEGVGKGAIVELGAWLGASTAYIASAIRDSGSDQKAQVYDKFQSKPGHAQKVKTFYAKKGIEAMPIGPCLLDFQKNLGPLMGHVETHPGQIENLKWKGGPISVLITDAPKRVPQISSVLTKFKDALQPGSVMAWQDFCHFPSYEIPACLYRLRDRLEFVEAVVPGTTLVFRVASQWAANEVSEQALSLGNWTAAEIDTAWAYWSHFVPAEKAALFQCGQAMFLCDIGETTEAVAVLGDVADDYAVQAKWRYLHEARPDFVKRYKPLFGVMQGALC